MSETAASPEGLNMARFQFLLAAAEQNPTGDLIWYQRMPRENAADFQVWQYSHLTENDLGELPAATRPHGLGYRYHYQTWNTRDLLVEDFVLDRGHGSNPAPKTEYMHPDLLVVPHLCATFIRPCRDADDLGAYTETFADWSQRSNDPYSGATRRTMSYLIASSLLTAGNPLGDPDSRVSQALRQLHKGSANYATLTTGATRILGAMLRGEFPDDLSHDITRETQNPVKRYASELLATAAQLYDARLLDRSFWLHYGVQANGVFTVPGMLELTHDYLTQPEGIEAIQQQEISSMNSRLRDYVSSLLRTCSTDERYNQQAITKIRTATRGPQPGSVSLTNLITFANGLASRFNTETLKAAPDTPHEQLLPSLDKNNLGHLGTALVRTLRAATGRAVTPEQARDLARTESLHTGILEELRMGLREPTTIPSLVDMRLRYPRASESDIDAMLEGMREGQQPATVNVWYRSKYRADGSVKAQSIGRPGHGLLSYLKDSVQTLNQNESPSRL